MLTRQQIESKVLSFEKVFKGGTWTFEYEIVEYRGQEAWHVIKETSQFGDVLQRDVYFNTFYQMLSKVE